HVILCVALVRRQVNSFARLYVDNVNILVRARLTSINEQRAIVRRPAANRVITARSSGDQLFLGVFQALHVDVESAGLLAIAAKRDGFAIVTPAAKIVDRFRLSRDVFGTPPFANIVVGSLADTFQVVELGALVAAAIHREDQLVAQRAIVSAS